MAPRTSKRPTLEKWQEIRAEYETTGITINALAKKHGLSHTAVGKRCKEEGWKRDAEDAIRRRTEEKVAGLNATISPEKKDAAIDAEASKRADVIKRHREEWNAVRALSYAAIRQKDFEHAKLAKISSETLKIIQDGERKAWGLDAADPADKTVVVIERSGAGG